jgi:hypothetical protein
MLAAREKDEIGRSHAATSPVDAGARAEDRLVRRIVDLQRTAGNAAVARALRGGGSPTGLGVDADMDDAFAEPEDPLALPEYQEPVRLAWEAFMVLQPWVGIRKTYALVLGGDRFESGVVDRGGFTGKAAAVEQVRAEGVEAGHETEAHAFDCNCGGEGGYESSHAERQAANKHPDEPIGVSKRLCDSCQRWFQTRAAARKCAQIICDPDGVRVFMPTGRVFGPLRIDCVSDVATLAARRP